MLTWSTLNVFQAIVITWLVSAAVCDGLIALALSWHLVCLQIPLVFVSHPTS